MEIIVRPVHICRHHRHKTLAILLVEFLTHLEARDLGYSVPLIRRFENARKK